MKQILEVGEDAALLASRAALLSRTDATVTCCNSLEFATQLQGDGFDLVILCYSLENSIRQAIASSVHLRWPKARLLLVAAEAELDPVSRMQCHVDAITTSMQPAQFVRTATSLLADSQAA